MSTRNGVLLVGEPMGLLIAQNSGPLKDVRAYTMAIAGAEYNVAIGLTRLGDQVSYLTKLGEDFIGRRIGSAMEAAGIGTSSVVWSDDHPTGLMFKGHNPAGDPPIEYFRKNSAASTLSPDDLRSIDWNRYRFLHLTGIMPALSPTCWDACIYLTESARTHGVSLTFDPNLRPQLWADEKVMVTRINDLSQRADIIFPGIAEARLLTGQSTPQTICDWYRMRGVSTVVLKTGPQGAYVCSDEISQYVAGFVASDIVDTVGAGDGFAAGVLHGLCNDLDLITAVEHGNAIGAIQVQHEGDNEGLPTPQKLDFFIANTKRVRLENSEK